MNKELYRAFSDSIHNAVDNYAKETGIRTPLDMMIELTRLCSIKCTHCYIGDARWTKDPNEMTTPQIFALLDYLAERGTLFICFTGGEALVRRDFKDIWLYAKKKGFLLTLFTNATQMTEDMADFLLEHPPFNIEVSIYGATEETYEKVSLVKGSYKRCISGIENLVARPQLKWILKTVMIRENAHELEMMEELAAAWGVEFKFDPIINASVGYGKSGGKAPCTNRLTTSEVAEAELGRFDKMKENLNLVAHLLDGSVSSQEDNSHIRSNDLFGCKAGISDAYINADGKMQMCTLTVQYGNRIIDQGQFSPQKFEMAWDSFGLARQAKLREDSPCRDCDIAAICSNCPGFAFLENGDEHSAVEHLCRITHQKAEMLKVPHVCNERHFVHNKEKQGPEYGQQKNSTQEAVPSTHG